MTTINKTDPSQFIEYIPCSGIDKLVFRIGTYDKTMQINSISPARAYSMVLDELNHFRILRNARFKTVPPHFSIIAYENKVPRAVAVWEEWTYRIEKKNKVDIYNFLVFNGVTLLNETTK